MYASMVLWALILCPMAYYAATGAEALIMGARHIFKMIAKGK